MEILALVLIFYFLVGAGVCLLICVNPHDPGILGSLNRIVFNKIPNILASIIKKIFGQRVLNFFGSIKHYLMETNHPIVQIFYLLIAVGGFLLYEIKGIFKFMPNNSISDTHVVIANLFAFICFWIYYKACSTSAGFVKQNNESQYVNKYKDCYDEVIYFSNNKCRTCKMIKPARSKHCSICKGCVAKYDHHCVWIRQCVGQCNYKYFVSFLFLHGIWCCYLSIIGAISLQEHLAKIRFWEMKFRMENQVVSASYLLAFQYLLMMQTIFFFLIIMCAIMGITLIIFVTYHFYLISINKTTNQKVKINDEQNFLRKQTKYLQVYQQKLIQMNQGKLPKIIPFKNQSLTQKQFIAYKEQYIRNLAILTKKKFNPGFISNLKTIIKQ